MGLNLRSISDGEVFVITPYFGSCEFFRATYLSTLNTWSGLRFLVLNALSGVYSLSNVSGQFDLSRGGMALFVTSKMSGDLKREFHIFRSRCHLQSTGNLLSLLLRSAIKFASWAIWGISFLIKINSSMGLIIVTNDTLIIDVELFIVALPSSHLLISLRVNYSRYSNWLRFISRLLEFSEILAG